MKALALLLLLLVPASAAAGGEITRSSMGGDIDVDDAPDGAVLRTMGGDIRVGRARGHVVAKTMGGDIRVRDLVGSLDAGTMGGNVTVEVDGVAGSRSLSLHSMGGSVTLTLPASFSGTFEIELEQNHEGPEGRIISDFPLEIRKSRRKRWWRPDVDVLNATGRVGSGDARVKIDTIGSDVTIRKR
ncbi:MAG TPA: hypothetical protein VEO54_05060 [Thermoanaerobaculia bacterium]|nr:hypothetical protein [Thermoanaerobaculia bacterium]